jgi:hypothetical protein
MRLLDTLKALALATVPVVGAFAMWTLWPVHGAILGARAQGYTLAVKAGAVLGHVDNAALAGGKLINDSRVTVSEMNRAALDERKYFEVMLPPLLSQAQGILANVQTDTADLHTVLLAGAGTANAASAAIQTANSSIPRTQPLVDAATLAIGHADATTVRVNAFLDAPLLTDTGKHTASIVAHADAITGDAQFEADRFTHPPPQRWYQKVWHISVQVGTLVYDFIR